MIRITSEAEEELAALSSTLSPSGAEVVRLVRIEDGRVEFGMGDGAVDDLLIYVGNDVVAQVSREVEGVLGERTIAFDEESRHFVVRG